MSYSWLKIACSGLGLVSFSFLPITIKEKVHVGKFSNLALGYPTDYFRSPLDIPLYLSGSFGELRPNHFHSGIDIKTNAKEGYSVYAVADGYVSRIRIQASGFGNAIYITHPNGFVSVYAHLKNYNWAIGKEAKKKQYEKESFEIDEHYTVATGLRVSKGNLIAYSGNSGSSGGPHLHFEIRDEKTEMTLNPALFGMPIQDDIKPTIAGLYIYPVKGGMVNRTAARLRIPLTIANGLYSTAIPIRVKGKIGFGIEAIDKHNGSSNSNGLYSVELKWDGKVIYYANFEKFSFSETKAINSYLDYYEKLKSGKDIQKSFVDDGNSLSIYKSLVNKGFVFVNDTNTHQVDYVLVDAHKNKTLLSFTVKGELADGPALGTSFTLGKTFAYQKENTFSTELVQVKVPANSLYDTIDFDYTTSAAAAGSYSITHHIHTKYTPLQYPAEVAIKVNSDALAYKDKLIMVNEKNRSQGGTWKEGWVVANIKNFGNFYIVADTVPPTIKPITINDGKNMSLNSAILIRIGDNLSGVKSYRATIDGKWTLMAFDGKSGILSHYFDERTIAGEHKFELELIDYKNNTSKYAASFYR